MAKSKANTRAGARPKASRREGRAPAAATAKAESGAASALPGRSAAPRKQAAVIGLLEREQGATLADLVDATGWLAHTTRAALTRLRQAGHEARRHLSAPCALPHHAKESCTGTDRKASPPHPHRRRSREASHPDDGVGQLPPADGRASRPCGRDRPCEDHAVSPRTR